MGLEGYVWDLIIIIALGYQLISKRVTVSSFYIRKAEELMAITIGPGTTYT